MTLPISTNLSDADLVTRAAELTAGTGCTFRIVRRRIAFQGSLPGLETAAETLKAEAARLREESRTHAGYVAGKGLHAARFEILSANVRAYCANARRDLRLGSAR